jgi:hypothetical protein
MIIFFLISITAVSLSHLKHLEIRQVMQEKREV